MPNDPNQDSFLGSEFVGIWIVNEGIGILVSSDYPPTGLAANAFEMLFKKFSFFYLDYFIVSGLFWLPLSWPLCLLLAEF
jgi:hypothetical protein